MKTKSTKIQLKFEVSDDDPLKKEIFEAFATLMKLLDRKDDAIPLKNGVEEVQEYIEACIKAAVEEKDKEIMELKAKLAEKEGK